MWQCLISCSPSYLSGDVKLYSCVHIWHALLKTILSLSYHQTVWQWQFTSSHDPCLWNHLLIHIPEAPTLNIKKKKKQKKKKKKKKKKPLPPKSVAFRKNSQKYKMLGIPPLFFWGGGTSVEGACSDPQPQPPTFFQTLWRFCYQKLSHI